MASLSAAKDHAAEDRAPGAAAEAWDEQDPCAFARSVVQRSGTSFFWGMRLLPEAKRTAMYAIYAFCREVDDIADDPAPVALKQRRLAEWREEIARVYDGAPKLPIGRALAAPVAAFGLRREDFLAVIAGMETDAAERLRLATVAELDQYCDRVACAVGRLSVRVFGVQEPDAAALADAQGRALQLTNILRDLHDDAGRDRLYLPTDMLRTHGIQAREPDEVLRDDRLPALCDLLAVRADAYFAQTRRILSRCDRRQVRPARIMMEVYERILRRLIARGWRRASEPVGLSSGAKLWIAVRHGML
jgi:phytoene synthase